MPIAAPVNKAARVRQLAQQHPNLSPSDIAASTGYRLAEVKAALGRGEARKQPQSRTNEARGPMKAGESDRLRMPVAAERRVTG